MPSDDWTYESITIDLPTVACDPLLEWGRRGPYPAEEPIKLTPGEATALHLIREAVLDLDLAPPEFRLYDAPDPSPAARDPHAIHGTEGPDLLAALEASVKEAKATRAARKATEAGEASA